jgi:GTP-binding protein HflX
VTDTVGFIRKLPHDLVASFRSTLEEAGEADVLLHVIDASHSDWEEHFEVVDAVLEELGLKDHDRVIVFNKVDRLTHGEEEALRDRIRALEPIPAVFVSALQPESLDALRDTLLARLLARLSHVVVHLPVEDGEGIASVYREGDVVGRVDDDATVVITARLPPALVGRLARRKGVVIENVA